MLNVLKPIAVEVLQLPGRSFFHGAMLRHHSFFKLEPSTRVKDVRVCVSMHLSFDCARILRTNFPV